VSEREPSIAESVDNEDSTTSHDEDDQKSDADSYSSVSTVIDADYPQEQALSSQGLVLERSAPASESLLPDVDVTSLSEDSDSELENKDDDESESNEEEYMESNNSSCKLFCAV